MLPSGRRVDYRTSAKDVRHASELRLKLSQQEEMLQAP